MKRLAEKKWLVLIKYTSLVHYKSYMYINTYVHAKSLHREKLYFLKISINWFKCKNYILYNLKRIFPKNTTANIIHSLTVLGAVIKCSKDIAS